MKHLIPGPVRHDRGFRNGGEVMSLAFLKEENNLYLIALRRFVATLRNFIEFIGESYVMSKRSGRIAPIGVSRN